MHRPIRLTLQDNGYLLDGEILPFVKKVVIKVCNQDGTLEDNEITLRYLSMDNYWAKTQSITIKVAGLGSDSYYFQYTRW